MELSPEEKKRIYAEEKERLIAQEKAKKELQDEKDEKARLAQEKPKQDKLRKNVTNKQLGVGCLVLIVLIFLIAKIVSQKAPVDDIQKPTLQQKTAVSRTETDFSVTELQRKKAELENKYAELKNYKKKILELFKPSDEITKKYLDALKNNNRFEAYEYAKQGKSINFKIFGDLPSLKVPEEMKKANESYELVAMYRKEAYGDVIKYFDNNYKLRYLSSYKENMNNAGVAQLSATGKLVVSIIKVEEKLREVKKQLKELEKEGDKR